MLMPERQRFAIDVDEVLFPFVREFVNYDNPRWGGWLKFSQFFSYRFEEVLEVPVEEAMKRTYDFYGAKHDHIKPLEDASEVLPRLCKYYEPIIITARPPRFEKKTRGWLAKHLDIEFNEIVHIGRSDIVERPISKAEVCRRLGAVALIDDSLEHTAECAAIEIDGLLFGNYPWNQADVLPEGVTRCRNWWAVEDYMMYK